MLANVFPGSIGVKRIREQARSYNASACRILAGVPWLAAALVIVRATGLKENFPIHSTR
ncbi:hypothetical protein ACOXVJ_22990 [Pseudomonas knackmussii]|uniref:hypothetical protein n=1 Tax=Pseudomonas knackmussii TaxID=65741 RepID=UPI003BC89A51